MSFTAPTRKFWVYFKDDTLDPIPVRARGRAEAFSVGRRYSGPFGDYRNTTVMAAVDKKGGETFEDVPEDEFITEDDV